MSEPRVVVYGGAFNPPTRAHESIIDTLLKRLNVQRLMIVPVGDHYHKEALVPFHHRYAMLQALYGGHPAIEISALENQGRTFLGTVHTLDELQKTIDHPLTYVLGADHLAQMHTWIESERLLQSYRFIVFNRGRQALKERLKNDPFLQRYTDRFICIEDVDFPEASRVYRQTLDANVLSSRIATYVQTHRLYEKE